jgi:hypothetical protein
METLSKGDLQNVGSFYNALNGEYALLYPKMKVKMDSRVLIT